MLRTAFRPFLQRFRCSRPLFRTYTNDPLTEEDSLPFYYKFDRQAEDCRDLRAYLEHVNTAFIGNQTNLLRPINFAAILHNIGDHERAKPLVGDKTEQQKQIEGRQEMYTKLAKLILARRGNEDMKPGELAAIAKGFVPWHPCKLKAKVYSMLSYLSLPMLSDFSANEIGFLANGFARSDKDNTEMFDAIKDTVCGNLVSYNASELTHITQSLALAGAFDVRFFNALNASTLLLLESFEPDMFSLFLTAVKTGLKNCEDSGRLLEETPSVEGFEQLNGNGFLAKLRDYSVKMYPNTTAEELVNMTEALSELNLIDASLHRVILTSFKDVSEEVDEAMFKVLVGSLRKSGQDVGELLDMATPGQKSVWASMVV